jgi:cysteine desulfurase
LDLGVDLYTISAHKIYAPRGVGGLWVKSGVIVDPLLIGGGQENGFRSSTERFKRSRRTSFGRERERSF